MDARWIIFPMDGRHASLTLSLAFLAHARPQLYNRYASVLRTTAVYHCSLARKCLHRLLVYMTPATTASKMLTHDLSTPILFCLTTCQMSIPSTGENSLRISFVITIGFSMATCRILVPDCFTQRYTLLRLETSTSGVSIAILCDVCGHTTGSTCQSGCLQRWIMDVHEEEN